MLKQKIWHIFGIFPLLETVKICKKSWCFSIDFSHKRCLVDLMAYSDNFVGESVDVNFDCNLI